MSANEKYRFERLNDSNFESFYQLHQKVFGTRLSEDEFKAKYDTKYVTKGYWGFLAYGDDEEAVAFYGVIPTFMTIGGNKILTAQSADTMTLPRHRGNGLFSSLFLETVELMKGEEFEFIFGFPNQLSMPIFKDKLGWELYGTFNFYRLNKSGNIFSRRFRKLKDEAIYDRLEDRLVVDFPEVTTLDNYVVRNTDYLKHKHSPEHQLLLVDGYRYIVKISNGLQLGAVLENSEEEQLAGMKVFESFLSKVKIRNVLYSVTSNSLIDKYLREESFLLGTLPVSFYSIKENTADYSQLRFELLDFDTF